MRMSPGITEALLPRKTCNVLFETCLHDENENSDPTTPYVEEQILLEGKFVPETVTNLDGKTYRGVMEPDMTGVRTMRIFWTLD